MWLKTYFIPATITEAENEYFKQAPAPKSPEPVVLEHPINPATQTGASALLGGALSIHAPQSMEPAIKLICEFEGFESRAYPDPLSGGAPWTIGYGSTTVNGAKVRRGDVITQQAAMAELRRELRNMEAYLAQRIPYWAEMNASQRGALLSFAWNLGKNFYGSNGFFSITRALKNKDWASVPAILQRYRNPGTSVEAGLLRRRVAEGRMWSTPSATIIG